MPEEDYGYILLNITLPTAASLERTDEVCHTVDDILASTKGIHAYSTIVGFSLLTRVSASNSGFYFVGLSPWKRAARARRAGIVNGLNATFRKRIPQATVIAIMPPSIPGLGSQGGFTFWLQDRGGNTVDYLDQMTQKFLAAARQRPELTGVASPFSAGIPQIYVNVDRDKVLKQGVAPTDVYQTMQAFLGGLFVNQFNRFGRQWRVFLEAEGANRNTPDDIDQFYVRNSAGTMVPLSTLATTQPTFGPQYTNRFNVYRAAQITGKSAPGYSSGPGT